MTNQEIEAKKAYHKKATKLLDKLETCKMQLGVHPTSEVYISQWDNALKDWEEFNEGSPDIYSVADHPTN